MLEEKPIPWRELMETVFRRRRLLLGVTILGLAATLALVALEPDRYQATARILLTAQPLPDPRVEAMSDRQIQAELAFLKSPELIRAVLESDSGEPNHSPQTEPGPLGRIRATVTRLSDELHNLFRGSPPATDLERTILGLAEQIEARSIDGTNVVEVAYTDTDAEGAARFVNDLLHQHVKRIVRLGEQNDAQAFFREQGNLLGTRLQESREALSRFRDRRGGSLLAGDEEQLRRVITRLESDRVAAETRVLEQEARVAYLSEEIGKHPKTVDAESRTSENESVRMLRSRILELELQRSELLSRYTPTSTLVQEVDRQIAEAERLLEEKRGETLAETMTAVNPSYQALEVDLVQTRAQLTEARARVGALSSQIAQYREKLKDLEAATAELERLESEVETAKTAYQQYRQKEEEARLSTAFDESENVNVAIVEQAKVPVSPLPSNGGQKVALGGGAAFLLGLLLAFLRDWLDPTVKSSVEASRLSRLPVIAEIPS